jgi:hypothetical protein
VKERAMRFAVMMWAGDDVKAESIFGVIDEQNPDATLPPVSSNGFWADFLVIDERQFRFADDAKASIDKQGYYLMGAGVAMTEVFEAPNKTAA